MRIENYDHVKTRAKETFIEIQETQKITFLKKEKDIVESRREKLERVFEKLEISDALRKAYLDHYDLGIETSKLAIELQIHEHLLTNKFNLITKEFSNFMDENAELVFEGDENGENKDRSTGEI